MCGLIEKQNSSYKVITIFKSILKGRKKGRKEKKKEGRDRGEEDTEINLATC